MEIVAFDLQNYAFVTYSFIQREWSFLSVFLLVLLIFINTRKIAEITKQLAKNVQFQKIINTSLPPTEGFCFCISPLLPGNSSLTSYFASKILASKTTLLPH